MHRRHAFVLPTAVLALVLALSGCATGTTGPGEAEGDIVIGTWSSAEKGEPHLTFQEDGTYTGSDGCNGLAGSYSQTDETIVLEPGLATRKACIGVDAWLFGAHTASLSEDSLIVFSKDGTEIGTLTRQG
ncbi:META domain-containing protein [Microbacterium aurantiacum]|uniref:META domain-containing protein n=1 Tax=Microbacterium aurantiacum TaxID=162393 RepID=UPI0015E086B7|nr:META domain-containing protein [Microbacterium aurantiacum]